MLPGTLVGAGMAACALLAGCTSAPSTSSTSVASPSSSASPTSASPTAGVERVSGGPGGTYLVPQGIHKIKHVIIVMQENRSFDSYFGTYPGADGIPMSDGTPTVCVPNPAGGCSRPYHDVADVNGGGPHGEANAVADVDGGRMDGFIAQRDGANSTCNGDTELLDLRSGLHPR
jgi:phospholipase C